MGSNIISGSAKAVILTTGNSTYLGSMAKSLNTYQDKSSFERNINSISSLLIRFMVVMVPVIFIFNFITKGNWLDSLMFGISTLAVVAATLLIGFTGIAGFLDLPVMVPSFALWLAGLMIVYTIFAQIMKRIYMKINHEWV